MATNNGNRDQSAYENKFADFIRMLTQTKAVVPAQPL